MQKRGDESDKTKTAISTDEIMDWKQLSRSAGHLLFTEGVV